MTRESHVSLTHTFYSGGAAETLSISLSSQPISRYYHSAEVRNLFCPARAHPFIIPTSRGTIWLPRNRHRAFPPRNVTYCQAAKRLPSPLPPPTRQPPASSPSRLSSGARRR